jgi:hypothetical protein
MSLHLAHLVDDLKVRALCLRLQLCRPVDVGLPLRGVIILQVEPRNLEIRL